MGTQGVTTSSVGEGRGDLGGGVSLRWKACMYPRGGSPIGRFSEGLLPLPRCKV